MKFFIRFNENFYINYKIIEKKYLIFYLKQFPSTIWTFPFSYFSLNVSNAIFQFHFLLMRSFYACSRYSNLKQKKYDIYSFR